MATFTVTTTTNITSLSGKGANTADIYNINGGTLIYDCDTRYGLNMATSSVLGTVTVSATLGGTFRIDGRKVRLIPFSSATGTLPAMDTTVTQAGTGASGKIIGVYSSLTTAPVVSGTIPASGYIKIREWNDIEFDTSALTLSGCVVSPSGPSVVGFIEVCGYEASTINANRLGKVEILGDWFLLGTTSGVSNQTLQIPTNGSARYAGGVFIEKSVGSNTYEFYPNALTATTTGTEADRGKCCWIDATGLVRLGNSGAATNGYTPISGLKVVIGNVFLENVVTTYTANTIPNATLVTRYDFTTTGGGVVEMSKVSCAWYMSFAQAYSISIQDVGTIDSVAISEIATPMTITRLGVGNKPTTVLLASPLIMSLCFAGGTFTECVFQRATAASANQVVVSLTDINGFSFVDCISRIAVLRSSTLPLSWNATRAVSCTWTRTYLIGGQLQLVTCTDCAVNDTIFVNAVSGTTISTNPISAFVLSTNCLNITISGLTFPITNNHPYTAILSINAAGCTNIKLRNIGTRAAPLTLGSSSATGLIYTLAASAAANNVKIQRVYCSNTRTGVMTGDNSSTNVTEENVFGDYADAADVGAVLNYLVKGRGTSLAYTAQTGVYGTHWADHFTSATVGRIAIRMNEPSSSTASQVTLTGGAAFTATGGLYMPTIGQKAVFEMPYFALGHTSFQNSSPVMAGGTIGNYNFRYQIDKNNGSGWSTISGLLTAAALATALSGETSISASLGVKIRLEVETVTTNTTAITSLYILTNSSAASQDYLYPLDPVASYFELTGLSSDTYVVLFDSSYNVIAGNTTTAVGVTGVFTYNYTWVSDINNCHVLIWSPSKGVIRLDSINLTSVPKSLPIFQADDLVYNATNAGVGISSIDYTNKLFILDSSNALDVQRLYSGWKIDLKNTPANCQYDFAFSALGGNVISGVKSIPFYVFLINSWKIRPQEASATLNVTAGILVATGDPFVNTIGSYVVRINYEQPVQAISVSTTGGGGATAAEVWDLPLEGAYTGRQLIRLMSSILAGETTVVPGAGQTATATFRDVNNTTDRVVASMDGSDRTSLTYTVT